MSAVVVVFHRINESVVLGMHPASLYPRRNRDAPVERLSRSQGRVDSSILRPLYKGVKLLYNLSLLELDV